MNNCPWPSCPETFDERGDIKDHLSSSHLDYYPYRCGRCRIMFPSRIQVEYHWSAEHEDEGPLNVACCLIRAKEQRLETLLFAVPATRGSKHATATAKSTSKSSIDLENFFRHPPRPSQAAAVFEKENSAFDESLAGGESVVGERSPERTDFNDTMSAAAAVSAVSAALSANSSPSSSSPSSPQMFNKPQLPAEVIEQIRDITATRPKLSDASVEQRAKYFSSQLAVALPNISLADIQSSFTTSQKSTLAATLNVQRWPATAILETMLNEYKDSLPSNNAHLLAIVRNCIAHAKKIINQHICRERENLYTTLSTGKKPRVESRQDGD